METASVSAPAPRARWPFIVSAAFAFVVYGVWWALMVLVHTLGTCGEDADLDTQEEYDRLCGSGGELSDGLLLHVAIAAVATLVLGVTAVRRRRWLPVIALAVVLLVLGRATLTLG